MYSLYEVVTPRRLPAVHSLLLLINQWSGPSSSSWLVDRWGAAPEGEEVPETERTVEWPGSPAPQPVSPTRAHTECDGVGRTREDVMGVVW